MQLVSVAVPQLMYRPPPCRGGVAADGAVGQRGRAVVTVHPAAVDAAELPLTVQLVSVSVPSSLSRPPPLPVVLPAGDRQSRDRRRDIASTWNTRLSPPPLTVTPAAGPVIVSVPVVLLSSSWPPVRVIVCGVLKTDWSNVDRVGPRGRIRQADLIAQRADAAVGGVGHGEGPWRRKLIFSKTTPTPFAPPRAAVP